MGDRSGVRNYGRAGGDRPLEAIVFPRNYSASKVPLWRLARAFSSMVVSMPSVRLDWTIAAMLSCAAGAVYAPVLRCGFINFDDPYYVTNNQRVADGLSLSGIEWAFSSSYVANWHPLTWLSLQLDATLWKRPDNSLNPLGFHLTNVLLHATNAALVFLSFRSLTRARWRSAITALIFCVHPLRVESVAWVTERKDLLSACFGLLTLWSYAAYTRTPSLAGYLFVASAFVASLLSKPMLVTLPFLLLVLDWWPLGRLAVRGRCLVEKLPLIALTLVVCLVVYRVQAIDGSVGGLVEYPLGQRAANAAVSYLVYLRQMIWPAGLAVYYPHPGSSLPSLAVAAAAASLAVLTLAAVLRRRSAPYFLAGWLWYLGTLVPVIGLLQVGSQARADRYTYFPQLGILLAVCWGMADLGRNRPRATAAAVAAAALTLSAVTWTQIATWRDSVSVWKNDIKATGGNRLAWYNLGSAREEQNDPEAAVNCYRAALDYRSVLPLFPSEPQVRISLGNVLQKTGRLDAAVEQFQVLCRLAPESALAQTFLGNALFQQGKLIEAARHLQASLRLVPDRIDVCCTLGEIETRLGNLDRARAWFVKACQLQPESACGHCGLGIALLLQSRVQEAASELTYAIRRDPHCGQAHYYLGKLLGSKGERDASAAHLDQAARLDPHAAPIWYDLGNARAQQGRIEEAARSFAHALALEPQSSAYQTALTSALDNLAKVGKIDLARKIKEDAYGLQVDGVRDEPPSQGFGQPGRFRP